MDTASFPSRKDKVVFVLGASGSGKSKLAISLATQFDGEVVNSDKMQVYDGLDVITNKVTEEECAGVPHHLLGGVHPDADFTAADFCREAMHAIDFILRRGRVPIVAGGSNSYIEALIGEFGSQYECCFVWVDVELPVLHPVVSVRVDKMVEKGLVEEARRLFHLNADYSRGIRRSIGEPEMDRYFRMEASVDEETRAGLLEAAVDEIKANTCKLTCIQRQKILRFCTLLGWDVHRIDATECFLKLGQEGEAEAWEQVVGTPSNEIVRKFLTDASGIKQQEITGNGDGDGDGDDNGISDHKSKGEEKSSEAGANRAVPEKLVKNVKGKSQTGANGIAASTEA